MHEFSLMANLLEKINHIAQSNHAERVTKVKVVIGAMAHISPEHFRGHFEQGTIGTIAENALLDVRLNPNQDDPHAGEILLEIVDVQ